MSPKTHFVWTNASGTWSMQKLLGLSNWPSWISDLRTMLGAQVFDAELNPSLFKFSFEQQALLQPSPTRDELLGTIYCVVGCAEYQWIVMQALTPYHAMRLLLHKIEDEWATEHGMTGCKCPMCGSSTRKKKNNNDTSRNGAQGRRGSIPTFKPTLQAASEFDHMLTPVPTLRAVERPSTTNSSAAGSARGNSEKTVSDSSMFASPASYAIGWDSPKP